MIMKRIALIMLTVFYMLPAIGFSINIHWCCNKISFVKITYLNEEKKCDCSKKKSSMKCCRNIHTIIKLTDNSKNESNFIAPSANFFLIPVFTVFKKISFNTLNNVILCAYHSPPPKCKHPIYLVYNVFRI